MKLNDEGFDITSAQNSELPPIARGMLELLTPQQLTAIYDQLDDAANHRIKSSLGELLLWLHSIDADRVPDTYKRTERGLRLFNGLNQKSTHAHLYLMALATLTHVHKVTPNVKYYDLARQKMADMLSDTSIYVREKLMAMVMYRAIFPDTKFAVTYNLDELSSLFKPIKGPENILLSVAYIKLLFPELLPLINLEPALGITRLIISPNDPSRDKDIREILVNFAKPDNILELVWALQVLYFNIGMPFGTGSEDDTGPSTVASNDEINPRNNLPPDLLY